VKGKRAAGRHLGLSSKLRRRYLPDKKGISMWGSIEGRGTERGSGVKDKGGKIWGNQSV